ncbi:unnamed protein product [Symbiodinium sp. KB8]|nr:unnamed protein product [Symbiodinium sp. KB8]
MSALAQSNKNMALEFFSYAMNGRANEGYGLRNPSATVHAHCQERFKLLKSAYIRVTVATATVVVVLVMAMEVAVAVRLCHFFFLPVVAGRSRFFLLIVVAILFGDTVAPHDGRGRGRWDDWDDWDWEGWQDDKKEHSKARKAWGPRGKKSDAERKARRAKGEYGPQDNPRYKAKGGPAVVVDEPNEAPPMPSSFLLLSPGGKSLEGGLLDCIVLWPSEPRLQSHRSYDLSPGVSLEGWWKQVDASTGTVFWFQERGRITTMVKPLTFVSVSGLHSEVMLSSVLPGSSELSLWPVSPLSKVSPRGRGRRHPASKWTDWTDVSPHKPPEIFWVHESGRKAFQEEKPDSSSEESRKRKRGGVPSKETVEAIGLALAKHLRKPSESQPTEPVPPVPKGPAQPFTPVVGKDVPAVAPLAVAKVTKAADDKAKAAVNAEAADSKAADQAKARAADPKAAEKVKAADPKATDKAKAPDSKAADKAKAPDSKAADSQAADKAKAAHSKAADQKAKAADEKASKATKSKEKKKKKA